MAKVFCVVLVAFCCLSSAMGSVYLRNRFRRPDFASASAQSSASASAQSGGGGGSASAHSSSSSSASSSGNGGQASANSQSSASASARNDINYCSDRYECEYGEEYCRCTYDSIYYCYDCYYVTPFRRGRRFPFGQRRRNDLFDLRRRRFPRRNRFDLW